MEHNVLIIKQLLDSVFVISGIIKVSVNVIILSLHGLNTDFYLSEIFFH